MGEHGHMPAGPARFGTELHAQHEATRRLASHDQTRPPYRVCVRRMAAFAIDCAAMATLGFLLAKSMATNLGFLNENY